jgi:tetratricopeptide (TPR) repeat protein
MTAKRIGAALALVALLSFTPAPRPVAATELFVNTDPIGAEVTIGGAKAGRTPLRIADFEGSAADLKIEKSGYVPLSASESMGGERRRLVFYTLSAIDLRLTLEQKGLDVYVNDRKAGRSPLSIDNLPAGTYELQKNDKGIYINNTSYQALKRSTKFEAAFAGGLTGLSLGGSVYFSNNGQNEEAKTLAITTVVFGGVLLYNLLKLAKIDTDYRKALKRLGTVEVESLDKKGPEDYFSTGMELVGREEWDGALANFLRVVNLYPDSQAVPISVYEAAYCHYRLENRQKAAEYFRMFLHTCPMYELFPYGVYYLLESELAGGNAARALEDYAALRPVRLEDPSGSLHKEYAAVLERLHVETGGSNLDALKDLVAELDDYGARQGGAAAAPEIALLRGRLIYTYLDRAEGSKVLNEVRQRYRGEKNIPEQVDRILRGG